MKHPLYRWEEFHLRQALMMLGGRWWMLAYSSESGLSEVLLRDLWTSCESHLFAPPEAR